MVSTQSIPLLAVIFRLLFGVTEIGGTSSVPASTFKKALKLIELDGSKLIAPLQMPCLKGPSCMFDSQSLVKCIMVDAVRLINTTGADKQA